MPGMKAPEAARREQILNAAFAVAAREGLDGTTMLRIAASAGLSPGLVAFHFKSKRLLLLALLDSLLASATVHDISENIAQLMTPTDRLVALLRQEMARVSSEPDRIRLMFDFWSAGIRDTEIGDRLRRQFDVYRATFRPFAAAVVDAETERFAGVTANGLAAVAVSFIKGCAVQSMIDPVHFDISEYLAAAEGLMTQFATPVST